MTAADIIARLGAIRAARQPIHLVNWSGGLCSFWAAKRVVDKENATNVFALFADTLIEDPELYAFNAKASAMLEIPLVRVSRELTPWQLFRRQGMIANNRFPICSIYLKREPLDEWTKTNCDPALTTIYLGFDASEAHRLEHLRSANPGWHYESPMQWEPIWDKCRIQQESAKLGFKTPRLYELGFPHFNCGGRCVRAGISHWVHLYKTWPERYLEWEREELETIDDLTKRGVSSAWFSFLRDRRGGETKTMTLAALRERIESGESLPKFEWGGCGCGGTYDSTTDH